MWLHLNHVKWRDISVIMQRVELLFDNLQLVSPVEVAIKSIFGLQQCKLYFVIESDSYSMGIGHLAQLVHTASCTS